MMTDTFSSQRIPPGYRQTEVGVIPKDWMTCRLRDLVDRANPIAYGVLKPGAYIHNGIPLLQIRDVIHGEIDIDQLHRISEDLDREYSRTKLVGGEIVVSLVGTIGKVALLPVTLAGGNLHRNLARIHISKGYDSKFICYFLNSDRAQAAIKLTTFGSTQALLNLADLRNLQVGFPPLPEQRAIATALSDVDGLLGGLDRLIAKKRDLKQAAMQQLLTGQTRLPGFDGEWDVKTFGELAVPRLERIDPRRTGVHDFCIELEHIESESGQILGSTSTGAQSSLKSVFHPGDVLFGKLRAYLRKYWRANRAGVCSTEIWVLVPRYAAITSEFLFQIIQTNDFIEAASNSYGTHMPRSDWNVVKNHELKLPSPIEQTAIAEVLTDMDAELAALEQRREKTRALKQAMMQELLTGRTRLVARGEARHT